MAAVSPSQRSSSPWRIPTNTETTPASRRAAKVDDGLLDLVVVGPVNFLNILPLIARLFLGTIDRSRNVQRLSGRSFIVERHAPGLIHTDGETHPTAANVEIAVRPRSLRVIVPQNSKAAAIEQLAPETLNPSLPYNSPEPASNNQQPVSPSHAGCNVIRYIQSGASMVLGQRGSERWAHSPGRATGRFVSP